MLKQLRRGWWLQNVWFLIPYDSKEPESFCNLCSLPVLYCPHVWVKEDPACPAAGTLWYGGCIFLKIGKKYCYRFMWTCNTTHTHTNSLECLFHKTLHKQDGIKLLFIKLQTHCEPLGGIYLTNQDIPIFCLFHEMGKFTWHFPLHPIILFFLKFMIKCSLKLAEMGYRGEQFYDTNDIWNYFISHQKYMEGSLFFSPNITAYLYFKISICIKECSFNFKGLFCI